MLRMAVYTGEGGPIGIVGIVNENILRMRAGMPLDINIKEITPPGTRINRLVVHLAETHEQIVDELEQSGLPVNDQLRDSARKLDVQLKKERRERGRQNG